MTGKPSMRAVLDHYNVDYNPSANQQKILCPVHGETNPSCSLHLGDAEFFKCFSCGAKGDVYDLVKGIEGIDFKAACRVIAGIPGAESAGVPEPANTRSRPVSEGQGSYKPRYRRAVPARVRKRAVDG